MNSGEKRAHSEVAYIITELCSFLSLIHFEFGRSTLLKKKNEDSRYVTVCSGGKVYIGDRPYSQCVTRNYRARVA